MKNIAIILSGGVGKRFGNDVPKQYLDINGKPCIDYVISSAKNSKLVDKIILVIDEQYIKLSKEINDDIEIIKNGETRYYSLKNAFDFIKIKYPECENIIILQAVSPLFTSNLIDLYLQKLEDNDCVITCRKLTGEIGNVDDYDMVFDRDKYFLMESPEAFKFNKLYDNFNPEFNSSELAYQLPKNSKKYLYFDFPQNIKITFPYELELCKIILKNQEKDS